MIERLRRLSDVLEKVANRREWKCLGALFILAVYFHASFLLLIIAADHLPLLLDYFEGLKERQEGALGRYFVDTGGLTIVGLFFLTFLAWFKRCNLRGTDTDNAKNRCCNCQEQNQESQEREDVPLSEAEGGEK